VFAELYNSWYNIVNNKKVLKTFQGTVQQYYYNLKSFFKNKESNPQPQPPFRSKKYFKVIYKKSAISYNNNILSLSNGRKGKPLKKTFSFKENT